MTASSSMPSSAWWGADDGDEIGILRSGTCYYAGDAGDAGDAGKQRHCHDALGLGFVL